MLLELSDHESDAHATALLQAVGSGARAGRRRRRRDRASVAQAAALWALREPSRRRRPEGRNIKHDIAVPISRIGRFIATDALLARERPGSRMVTFGHLGDGNLHYNVSAAGGRADEEFLERQPSVYAWCTTRWRATRDRSRPSTASAS